jgi:hypothetical protein
MRSAAQDDANDPLRLLKGQIAVGRTAFETAFA